MATSNDAERHRRSVARGERVLCEALGERVRLEFAEAVSDYPDAPSAIVRCRVRGGHSNQPETVILKVVRSDDSPFAVEWAGLQFLAGLEETRDLVPTPLVGDPAQRLMILEDLGSADDRGLGEILEGDDAERAVAALTALHRALGRLHAGTIGRRDEYSAIRARLGATGRSRHRVHELVESLKCLNRVPQDLGLEAESGFAGELDRAAAELRSPGGFLAFTHGDATPANAFFTGSRAVLFDLEASAYRHALLDGSFPRIRYIHSLWARRIPLTIQRALVGAYREELAKGCPEADDDDRFDHALACCSAAWLAGVLRFLPEALERDRRWGLSMNRQRIVAALEHFAALATELGRLPAITGTANALAAELRTRWGDEACNLGFYRAFRGI